MSNPLLSNLRIPGTVVRLPSRGLFYKNGEIDPTVTDGEVTITPMTLVDEIVMKSIDKLFSGDSINEVLTRCAPQILKPKMLLAKDVDFLMIQLRRISFGEQVEVKYNHKCNEAAKEQTYIVDISKDMLSKSREINIAAANTNDIKIGNQIVKLGPTIFADLIKILQANDKEIKEDERLERELDIICSAIRAVSEVGTTNMVTDTGFIKEWLRTIPRDWVKQMIDKMSTVSDWGSSTSVDLSCKDCQQPIKLDVPLNPLSFFT